MKDVIDDLIKLGTDVSKLTEKRLNSFANKLAQSKEITRKEAKKIVAAWIKRAAKAQRVLAKDLSVHAKKIIKEASRIKKKSRKA